MNELKTSTMENPIEASFDREADEARTEVLLPIYYNDVYHPDLDHLMWQENHIAAKQLASVDPEDASLPTMEEYRTLLFETTDLTELRRSLAASYCSRFDQLASEVLGFELRLRFRALRNYQSCGGGERILATLPTLSIARFYDLSALDGHEKLKALDTYSRNWTKADFRAEVESWIKVPLQLWDERKLSFLLESLVDGSVIDEAAIDQCMRLDAQKVFEDAVDWEWFGRKEEQLIAWKTADLARMETPKVTI